MRTVEVELPGRARALSCATEDPDVGLGDRVVVEQDGRTLFGCCARVPLDQPFPEGARLPAAVRRACPADEDRESQQQRLREECLEIARQQVREHNLPMRMVRAEPAAGGRRVTLYFLADGRVDFRELVRDLARRLRARVELRQIGVRDAAVLQGGYGHCGRGLCCAAFLDGFAPVSMKMAKSQGLPLNPAKISGQCGRLMCCLRYEIEHAAHADDEHEPADTHRSR